MTSPLPDPSLAPDELDLRDYLRVLRRRKGVVVASVLVVVIGALVASALQTPVYRAKTELVLQARSTEALFDPDTGQPRNPERAVQTEIKLIESGPVQAAVEEELGVEVPDVNASGAADTDIVEVSVEHTDPEQAALIANAYADAYIDFRRTQNVNDLLNAAQEIQAKIDELQVQIDAVDAGGEDGGEVTDSERSQRDQLVSQQALFRQQLDQLQVGAALKTGGAQIVTPAAAPSSPVRPTPIRSGVLAGVVGLILGVGLAFLFDYLDDSVRDKHDLDRATGGVPVLGLIPVVPDWKRAQRPMVVAREHPEGPTAEAYRALRTSVQFLGIDRTLRSVQITSSTAAEGKTTTVANLAVLFARAGHRVVAVDCDLRRPRLHAFFGLDNQVGFTTALLGDAPLSQAVQPVPEVSRLYVLPSGLVPPLPSELLSSHRTGAVLRTLEEEYDLVLIDSPPAVPVTDAAVLSSWVDGVILVANANMTSRRDFHRAVELLQQIEAPLIGTVLNQAAGEASYGDRYGYAYQYATKKDRAKAREDADAQIGQLRSPDSMPAPDSTSPRPSRPSRSSVPRRIDDDLVPGRSGRSNHQGEDQLQPAPIEPAGEEPFPFPPAPDQR